MAIFAVEVVIENKPYVRDPEGETILKDLFAVNGYGAVKGVRTAKLLRLTVEAEDGVKAKELVAAMCRDLRVYNPVVSACHISVKGE